MNREGTGAKVAAAAIGVAGAAGTKHLMYMHNAKKKGLTPIMICAVTKTKIYLLDWQGNHRKGNGSTRTLFEWSRNQVKIKNHRRGILFITQSTFAIIMAITQRLSAI